MRSAPATLHVEAWGRMDWLPAFEKQVERWKALHDGHGEPTFIGVEHNPVITIGRRGLHDELHLSRDELISRGIQVHDADRGGELTYHGPGQLTLYAIIDIRSLGIGPGDLVRHLAGAIADTIRRFGIDASYDPKHPGLWTRERKLAAVGMRIKRGISLHGAALNVSTSLDAFTLFVPCGMPDAQATSLTEEGAVDLPSLMDLTYDIAQPFAERLGLQLVDRRWNS